MHGGKDESCIGNLALNVSWTVIPIYAQSVDRVVLIVIGVKELHDSCQVVRFARWLAYEIHMVCSVLEKDRGFTKGDILTES